MKTINFKYVRLLLCLCALFIISCQQEDDYEKQKELVKQKSITKTVSGNDVPKVLSFIQSKSNSRMEFVLDDTNAPEGQFRTHEENLSLTSTLTEQIKQVTNGYGKSNYTFKLLEEEIKEGLYFLNLIVKEYKDTYYLYIVKYVPYTNWLINNGGIPDLYSFTGSIYFYSDEGYYLAKTEMINGVSNFLERHPCGEGNDDAGNDNSNGAGSTGGTSNTGSSDGGSTSDSSNGSTGSGTGGFNIDLFFDCCWCGGDLVGAHDHVECELTEINNYSANNNGNEISLSNFLRHPCDPIGGGCEGETDCDYGYNDDCSCLDEPDESGDVGIYIDFEEIIALNELTELFGENNFVTDHEIDLETIPAALHFETLEELEQFLFDLQNSEFTPVSEVLINEANNSVTTKCVFSDFLLNYNVWIEQELGEDYINFSDYSVNDVSSFDSGITVFHYYEQNSWSNQLDSYNSITDVYGTAHLTLIYKGIGRIISDVQHFQIVTNATNGSVISQHWIDKWVFD